MNDRYENIRRALAMGPTPGPWVVRYDYVVQARSYEDGRLVPVAQPYGANRLFANARLIGACDPNTIRELLDERDQLAADLEAAREDAERYRWLRDREIPEWLDLWHQNPDRIDAAIDQAMKEQA